MLLGLMLTLPPADGEAVLLPLIVPLGRRGSVSVASVRCGVSPSAPPAGGGGGVVRLFIITVVGIVGTGSVYTLAARALIGMNMVRSGESVVSQEAYGRVEYTLRGVVSLISPLI